MKDVSYKLHIDVEGENLLIQLFGSDEDSLHAQPLIQENNKTDIADINMGCL